MLNPQNSEQRALLLTAYFDDELDPKERAQAEAILAENPDEVAQLSQWRENQNTIRSLPTYQLSDNFAARVLSAVDLQTLAEPTQSNSLSEASFDVPGQLNWRVGLSSIVALAAMLLVSVFVFPALVGKSEPISTAALDLNADPAETDSAEIDSEPVESTTQSTKPVRQMPGRATRNSRRSNHGNAGQPVAPMVMTEYSQTSVEQVLWIECESIEKLTLALADQMLSTQVQNNPVAQAAESPAGVEALFVVAEMGKMKRAMAALCRDSQCQITAYPLPAGFPRETPATANVDRQPAVQQILPFLLSDEADDSNEIASLDKWFGLVSESQERQTIRFLLLVKTQ